MAEIFVDAGAWIGVLDRSDQYHRVASQLYRTLLQERNTLVTTNLVIGEAYNLLRRSVGHPPSMRFLHIIRTSANIQKIYSNQSLEHAATEILQQYADQDFSYVDAVSFALMRQRDIDTAFAFDSHFRIAGFQLVAAPAD